MIGLPRSGSTVLSAILNQNPDVYVTPNSPLLKYLLNMQEAYNNINESVANPCPEQITNICRAIIDSAWEHRSESIIVDKHRGWGKNLSAVTTITNKKPKILATVRDLPSIMASWLTLIKSYSDVFDQAILDRGILPIDENRVNQMWLNTTKDTLESLIMAKEFASDRLLIVDYDDFILNPIETLRKIENHFEISKHTYDFNHIEKFEIDDDLKAWGFPNLHKIRLKLEKTSKDAKLILGDKLYNKFVEIEKEYDYR